MKRALVLGAAGFIGMALTERLRRDGYFVQGIDIKTSDFGASQADLFAIADLRDGPIPVAFDYFDEVYQLAADMGGAGYIFTGAHDADVMANSVAINRNVVRLFTQTARCGRLLFTSSSCVYPERTDLLREEHAYPADPIGCDYGWEKLFSERLYRAHQRNYGLNVCITRFATIYGPGNCYDDGREKAVAALCRKAILADNDSEIEVWGDGGQVRPLIYIDDLIDCIVKLVRSDFDGPMNVSDPRTIRINELAQIIIGFSNKRLRIKNVPGPIGPYYRNLDWTLAERKLGWHVSTPLEAGLLKTYEWIAAQIAREPQAVAE